MIRSQKRETGLKQSLTLTSSRARSLDLLQHRVGDPRREDVAGQEQHREIRLIVAKRGTGDHVGRAWSDRSAAREGGEPVAMPGVADGGVHHRLLVAGLVVAQDVSLRTCPAVVRGVLALEERLTDARHVAVAEDAPAAREERRLDTVPLDALHPPQEAHDRLCDRQPGTHRTSPRLLVPNGSRGSTAWSVHVSRTQPWAGSSQIRHARSSPGPAITLR